MQMHLILSWKKKIDVLEGMVSFGFFLFVLRYKGVALIAEALV